MFENLTEKLERSFKILKGEGKITEINVAETLKEIRRALIDADVNYKVAKTFTDEVKNKALGMNVLTAVKPGQMLTKIVRDELAALMGGTATDIKLEGNPAVVLIAGLQGSGKTTFSGKLASFIKSKKGRQVLLVAGDGNDVEAILKVVLLRTEVGLGSTHKFAYLLIVHSISRVVVLTLSRLHFDEYQHIILLRDNVDFDVSMHWLPITLSDNVALLYQVLFLHCTLKEKICGA